MKSNLKIWAISCGIALIVGALLSYYALNAHFKAKLEGLTPRVVEVITYDTIIVEKPLLIEKRILEKDTIRMIVRDTIEIYLPREQKVYGDSTYRAVVSGIYPRLDSIYVYPKTITKISTPKEWRKWNFGVQAGVGVLIPIKSAPTFGGYIGFGVEYTF